MDSLSYFNYLRQYKKLNRPEPRVETASQFLRLMIPPFIAAVVVYVATKLLLNKTGISSEPLTYSDAVGILAAPLILVIILPWLAVLALFSLRVRRKLELDAAAAADLKKQMVFSHAPWMATISVLIVPCAPILTCLFCPYDTTKLSQYLLIKTTSIFFILTCAALGFTARKKMQCQVSQHPGLRPARVQLQLKDSNSQTKIFIQAMAIFLVLLGLFSLAFPYLISISPSKDDEKFHFSFFSGTQFVFCLLALISCYFGWYFLKKLKESGNELQELLSLDEASLLKSLKEMDDGKLAWLLPNVLLNQISELLPHVKTEMLDRGLLEDTNIESVDDLYQIVDEWMPNNNRRICVAKRYLLADGMYMLGFEPFFIRTEQLDSAVIKEQHAMVTMTLLEVRFQRKSFRDKFVLRTDKLNQWLALFEKLGVPVEDERAAK